MAEKERIHQSIATTLNVKGKFSLGGVQVTPSAVDLNSVAGLGLAGATKKVAKVALGTGASGGGVFAWLNPEAGAIVVNRLALDVTTASTGACSISSGKAANGTTSAANLIDTLDVHSATGTFDNIANPGAGGKPLARVSSGQYVTGSVASGTVTGLVGNAYIEYFVV